MAELVARRYGHALLELAIESGDLVNREQEIKHMLKAFTENREFFVLLTHPKLAKAEKIELMLELFEGKVSEDLIGFLALAIQKGRHESIIDILKYTLAKIEIHNGYLTAYITSAIPLSKEDEKLITNKLENQTGKKITLITTVDKAVIGGLFIRVNDRVVDNTVKSILHRMARDIFEAKV